MYIVGRDILEDVIKLLHLALFQGSSRIIAFEQAPQWFSE